MRKVVDSNLLQSPALRAYLDDGRNFAVLTDYAAMEAYKGDTLTSIFRSMEVIGERPAQVIILKHTQAAVALLGRARFPWQLIDQEQTRGFAGYCKQLAAARDGDLAVQRRLLENGRAATAHMDRMLADTLPLPDVFDDFARSFSREELAAIRRREDYDAKLCDRVMKTVLGLAGLLIRDHPEVQRVPKFPELPHTFIFRYALSCFLLALRWISVGGAKNVKPEKIRNDMVDMAFAAYATYFDGVLTHDEKLIDLHRATCAWLALLIDTPGATDGRLAP